MSYLKKMKQELVDVCKRHGHELCYAEILPRKGDLLNGETPRRVTFGDPYGGNEIHMHLCSNHKVTKAGDAMMVAPILGKLD